VRVGRSVGRSVEPPPKFDLQSVTHENATVALNWRNLYCCPALRRTYITYGGKREMVLKF